MRQALVTMPGARACSIASGRDLLFLDSPGGGCGHRYHWTSELQDIFGSREISC